MYVSCISFFLSPGIIIRYELFMQLQNESQRNATSYGPEQRVFLSSGWHNPRRSLSSANENALTPPESSTVVSNLESFSTYRFRVLTVNMAGSTLSEWATGRTAEGVPEYMPPPHVSPVSSCSLRVSWEMPQDKDVRGEVTEYRVNLQQEQMSNPYAPPIVTQVLYSGSAQERSYTAGGLKAYEEYSFTVTVCNRQGCVSSPPASGQTLPSGQYHPSTSGVPYKQPLMQSFYHSWICVCCVCCRSLRHVTNWAATSSERKELWVNHSMRLSQKPLQPWVILTACGEVESAHCTCMAGVAEKCAHVAALLYKIDTAVRLRGNVTPTDVEAYWVMPSNITKVQGAPGHTIDFTTSSARKKALDRSVCGDTSTAPKIWTRSGGTCLPQKTLADLKPLTELMHAHRSGLCSVMEEFCHLYADPIQPCVLPKSLLRLRDPRMDGCDLSVLLPHCEGLTHLVAVTATEAAALEKNTRQQHKSDIWHSTRAGRITASIIHAVVSTSITRPAKSTVEKFTEGRMELKQTHKYYKQVVLPELVAHHYTQPPPPVPSAEIPVPSADSQPTDKPRKRAQNTVRKTLATLQPAPAGLSAPTLRPLNMTVMKVSWDAPAELNGPPPLYHVERTDVSLSDTQGRVIRGRRFTGSGYFRFPSSTLPVNTDFTGFLKVKPEIFTGGDYVEISFEFKTDQLNAMLLFSYDIDGKDYILSLSLFHPRLCCAAGFGGCIRDVRFAPGPVVSLAAVSSSAVRVNLDGCLSADTSVNCRGNDSILVYTGRDRSAEDLTLQPFTEYLYRVMASEGGWTAGAWQWGRSRETGTLSGLAPFSSYSITLTACTQAGCRENPFATGFSTPQEAPEEVPSPAAISFPNSLSVHWDKPNGIITRYTLYKDNTVVYQGNITSFNITGVDVFTPHKLMLSACTEAECTNSSQVTLITERYANEVMDICSLWAAPMEVNGLLEFYTLYQSALGGEPAIVNNSSELFEDYTVRNLVPGSTYLFQIAVRSCLLFHHTHI
ncbi:hypothetical protein cypCar_00002776 [Cyprinus carpio]|nr:hypothetical protein cypCar_00002776 [Cyprinus carpio]